MLDLYFRKQKKNNSNNINSRIQEKMRSCAAKTLEITADTIGFLTELAKTDEVKFAFELVELVAHKKEYRKSSQRIIDQLLKSYQESHKDSNISHDRQEINPGNESDGSAQLPKDEKLERQ